MESEKKTHFNEFESKKRKFSKGVMKLLKTCDDVYFGDPKIKAKKEVDLLNRFDAFEEKWEDLIPKLIEEEKK